MLRKAGRQSDLNGVLREYWWVLLFIFLTFGGFLFAASAQKRVAVEIEQKIHMLNSQKKRALEEKSYLEQKIGSFDDPNFVRMTLIKVLGVTPKGQQKVVFDWIE